MSPYVFLIVLCGLICAYISSELCVKLNSKGIPTVYLLFYLMKDSISSYFNVLWTALYCSVTLFVVGSRMMCEIGRASCRERVFRAV